MKFTKRLFLLLLCFAVLSSAFSHVVGASSDSFFPDDVPTSTEIFSDLQIFSSLYYGNNNIHSGGTVYSGDSLRQNFSCNPSLTGDTSNIYYVLNIVNRDRSVLLSRDTPFFAILRNVYTYGYCLLSNLDTYELIFSSLSCELVYSDGSTFVLDDACISNDDFGYKIEFFGNLSKDVIEIKITLSCSYLSELLKDKDFVLYSEFGEPSSEDVPNSNVSFYSLSVETEEEELSFFENVISVIGNIFDSITSLPSKICTSFVNGLKDLFIPDSAFVSQAKYDFDVLLSQKFGAVYQVVGLVSDMSEDIQHYDAVDSVDVPEVTVEFSGVPFTFGGWHVKLVPDGFDFLVEALKTIVGVVCTFAFIGGMRRRYDEVFR